MGYYTYLHQFLLVKVARILPSLFTLALLLWSNTSYSSNNKNGKTRDEVKIETWLSQSRTALGKSAVQAKLYADSALNLAIKLKLQDLQYVAYSYIADAEQAAGNFEASFKLYSKTYEYKRKKGLKKEIGHLLNRMGEARRYLDDYKTALEYFQKSIRISEEIKDTNAVGSGYISIGILYSLKGEHESAVKYFLQAIDAFRSTGNQEREHLTILNLGGMYSEFGKPEKAVEYSKKAADFFQKKGNEKRMAVARYNLGVAYFELKRFAESKREYQICLPIFEKLGDNLRMNGTLMRLSEIALSEGKTEQALTDANRALKGVNSTGSRSTKIYLYSLISKIYKERKDYKSALEFRMLYEALKDSVRSEESDRATAELEAKYQDKIKQKEIASLQTSNKLNALVIKRKSAQNYVLAGFLFLITIVSLLLLNQYRTKKKSNDLLFQKNGIIEKALAEKEILLREIHHRVKNNLQFIWSLLNLQSRHIQDKETLKTLIEAKNRIKTMALIHQKLYMGVNLTGIDMVQYIPSLTANIFESYKEESNKVDVTYDLDPMVLDIDTAIPVALIMNEIITNSIKYAFEGIQNPTVHIQLKRDGEKLRLNITDNGHGFDVGPDGVEPASFGLKLVKTLTKQVKGEITLSTHSGVNFSMYFVNSKNLES